MSNHAIELGTPHNLSNDYSTFNTQVTYKCPNKLVTTFLAESFGMYIFILLSLGNVATFALYPESKLTWDGLAISWGLNLMFGVYIASFNSDAHLNPAVSLCMYVYNKSITLKELFLYTAAQVFGSFLAAATVYGIYFNRLGDDDGYSSVFVTYKNPSISLTAAFFTEFLGTALLAGGIFALCDHKSTKDHIPIYVGLLLSALAYSFGFPTAFAWNPARDFGPRLLTAIAGYNSFSYMDYYFWVPIIAPYLGALFGVFLYKILIQNHV
jgi:MIP family channel proteins